MADGRIRLYLELSVTVRELMGTAMGVVGLTFDDFCRLTFPELEEILHAHHEREESRMQDEWERMRLLAVMTMQPHCKGKLKPQKVLPFPWEKKKKEPRNSTPVLNKDQASAAFLARLRQSTPEGAPPVL